MNIFKKVFSRPKVIEFEWSQRNREETEALLKEYNIPFETIQDKTGQEAKWYLYINDVGGFVPERTKLFIYKNIVYKFKKRI